MVVHWICNDGYSLLNILYLRLNLSKVFRKMLANLWSQWSYEQETNFVANVFDWSWNYQDWRYDFAYVYTWIRFLRIESNDIEAFDAKSNYVTERYRFRQFKQQPRQSISDYICGLKQQAKSANTKTSYVTHLKSNWY